MLETISSYIDERPASRGILDLFWGVYGRDRRFAFILTCSVVSHIIFYVLILQLDMLSLRHQDANQAGQTELVQVAELALPPDRLPLRAAPEQVARDERDELKHDPDNADDVHLVSRSRNPGAKKETPSLPQPPKPRATDTTSQPPPSSSIAPVPQETALVPGEPLIAQANPLPDAAPPSLPRTPNASAPADFQLPVQGNAQRGQGDGAKSLGLEPVQSQYMAYVRKKISDTNERIMPRGLIESLLTRRVSAVFELQIGRGGQILSARLHRSTGYDNLDRVAREAIYNSRPFDGYPPNAGDSLTLTVTVYYAPIR